MDAHNINLAPKFKQNVVFPVANFAFFDYKFSNIKTFEQAKT